jgi:uncharacterized protein
MDKRYSFAQFHNKWEEIMKYGVLLLIAATGSASAASFDCKKATTLVEKEICSNQTLSKLDDALNQNYGGSLSSNIGDSARQHLMKTQSEWLKERNGCKTEACIEKKYRERIDALCEYPVLSGVNWGCVVSSDEIN